MSTPIRIPQRALVVLCGPSAVGKSTWARTHFLSSQIIASDICRQMVSDDLNWHEPAVSDAAFDLLYQWLEQRLRLGRLAVVDSTALLAGTRRHLLALARRWNAPAVLAMFDVDFETCAQRDAERLASVGRRVLRFQFKQLAAARPLIAKERWDHVVTLQGFADEWPPVEMVTLPHERPADAGPFDIIGDVHGCREELDSLLEVLGHVPDHHGLPRHPKGRRLIFVGDLACGGPDSVRAWDLALRLRAAGRAEILVGDHDRRFLRLLSGRENRLDRGLETVAREMPRHSTRVLESLRRQLAELVASTPPHLLLDGGRLAVAHAALRDSMLGKDSRAIRDFCTHGEGPRDPDRGRWVREHRTATLVVHGHRPVAQAAFDNHTLNIDTGCVLGGALTAFRWPEQDIVQVPAQAAHWPAEKSVDAARERVVAAPSLAG